MMRAALAAAFAVAVLPGVAHAASVTVYVPPCAEEQSKYGQCYPDEARFTAQPGERNDLTITSGPGGTLGQGTAVTFHDEGAPVQAMGNCQQVDDHTAKCISYALIAVVDVGDGDDSVSGSGQVKGGAGNDVLSGSSLDGGPGDDTLKGTDQTDVLTGGPGHDTIDGGAGNDTIVDGGAGPERDAVDGGPGTDLLAYDGRDDPIDLSLQEPSGAEDALAGVENLRGGDGNDRLTGDAGSNGIDGGVGDDTIAGGDGKDSMTGGPGSDVVQGGAGNDKLSPGEDGSRNTLTCGDGVDRAEPTPNTRLGSDCEVVGLDDFFPLSGTVRLQLPLRRSTAPVVVWTQPNCIDRPCRLTGTLTGTSGRVKGQLLGSFDFVARERGSKLPRRIGLRLNAAGRRAVRGGHRVRVRARIALDDDGDRNAQSFLLDI
jgi:hypothetical protein